MNSVLNIINANKNFDGTIALDDFSLDVPKSSIIGIIGPNGAGKTTLFNVITGFLTPDSGKIIYGGRDLNGLSPYRITRLGMVRTFQQLRLITRISVLDNIMLSFQNQSGEHLKVSFFFRGVLKNRREKITKKP